MNIQKDKEGVKTWYNLTAESFNKRYEGIGGFYWENFESKIVDELIDVKNKIVLDLGCGSGRYALSVYKRAKKVIGVDISEKMIEIAMEKLTLNMSTKFLVGDATSIPFKNQYFDVIVSLGMFEYLKDPSLFLREINRILKFNGDFLFTCYNDTIEFIEDKKISQLILRAMLKPMKNCIFGYHRDTTVLDNCNPSSEIRKGLYNKVAHTPRQINELLLRNGLKLITYRTFGFKIIDEFFHTAEKLQYKKIQNSIFIFSIFINRLCGLLPITKNRGGVLIIKARKIR